MEKSIYFFFQGIASKGLINSQIIIKTMVIFGKKKNGKKRQRQLDQTTARRMSKEKRKEKDKQHETF